MTIIQKMNKCWSGCRKIGTLTHCYWERKMVQLLWKKAGQLLKKLNTELPYDSAIPFLGMYLPKLNTYVYIKPCTQMITAALFIITRKEKQLKCPITEAG